MSLPFTSLATSHLDNQKHVVDYKDSQDLLSTNQAYRYVLKAPNLTH